MENLIEAHSVIKIRPKTFNLSVHSGGFYANEERVKAVETPAPTTTWTPIPHFEAYERVVEALRGRGMDVVAAAHALARRDKRYFATLQVQPEHPSGIIGLESTHIVGIRNSHDKSFPWGVVAGAGVFVCTNLSFSGEISIARRHTKYIEADIDAMLDEAVVALQRTFRIQDERFEAYKSSQIRTDGELNDLLIRSYEAGAFPITNLPKIKEEFINPTFEAFKRYGESLWRFHNSVTYVRKGSEIFVYPGQTEALEKLLDDAAGFSPRDFHLN